MNPYDKRFRDLVDGDPDLLQEYHQDYREGLHNRFMSAGFLLPLLLCSIPIIYHILFILDYDLLPLPELFWNIFVYLTPSRLLDAVENFTNPLRITNPGLRGIPRTHAAKCEAMRRILGLDKPGGIMGSVAQAGRRRLSTLPGINIAAQGFDSEKPAGLGNWDNSCYQNSVLQGLASLDSLSGYLTNPNIEMEAIEGGQNLDMKMAAALCSLIETLNNPSNNGKKIWTPAVLKNMSSWQQQDAQEYFSKVLDEIDKEVARVAKIPRLSQGFESDDSTSTISEASAMASFRNPLEGLTAQRVGCTRCGYSEGLSMTPFNCLTLPLTRAFEHDISECLDEFTKLEKIDGVECGKCTLLKYQRLLLTLIERFKDTPHDRTYLHSKERLGSIEAALEDDDYEEKTLVQKCKIPVKGRVSSTKTRQAVIARPPRSLVVHFNRSIFDEYTGELKKNSSGVRFPKILDLGRWCLGSSGTIEDASIEEWRLNPESPMIASTRLPSRQQGPIYELRAVVTHQGRHENGHYICYRKHPAPNSEGGKEMMNWWRLSDADVYKVTENTVLNQGGVFMLFYDLVEPALSSSQTRVAAMDGAVDQPETSQRLTGVASAARAFNSCQAPVEMTSLPDLAIAASIPLPEISDDDLSDFDDRSQKSLVTADEPSIATSVSEFDDEEPNEVQTNYKPVEPIVIPPYLPQTGVHTKEGEGTEQRAVLSPGSLLMV